MSSKTLPADGEMVAFRFIPGSTGGASVARQVIPIPTPGPDECLVKVLAAGVCHSDCSILDPDFQKGMFAMPNPFVLGHEGAGVVVSVGSNVTEFTPGSYVALLGSNACYGKSCGACSYGCENSCHTYPFLGFGADGFFASHVSTSARNLVQVPADQETVKPSIAAVSTDAVLTPYHSLITSANLTPDQTILVIGAGGLGLNAIQIAKHVIGVKNVIVSDIRDASVKAALEVGADYACKPQELDALVKEHKFAFDTVVDIVGNAETFATSLQQVRIGGLIQVIGLSVREFPLPLVAAAMKNVTIKLSAWGTRSELKEVLDAVASGKVKPQVEERPLEDCLEVLQDLATGKLKSRVALIP
jgi:propanol-preferring alcohol dehydrogenase